MVYCVKELREERNLTQEKLAIMAGCTRATINALENGESNTTTKTLSRIAAALDVPIKDLFVAENN